MINEGNEHVLNEEGDEEVREEHKEEAEEETLERRVGDEHTNIIDTEQDDGGSVPATVSTTPAAQVVERELRVHVYRNEGEAMEEEDQIDEVINEGNEHVLNEEGDEEVREEHKEEAEEETLERRVGDEHTNIIDTEQDDGGSVPATVSTTPAAQVVERELRVHVYRNEGEAMEEEDQIEEDRVGHTSYSPKETKA